MIDRKELRIGNWVQTITDKNKFQVRDGEDIDDLGKVDTYEPITITIEILEECGFQRKDMSGNVMYFKKGGWYYLSILVDERDFAFVFGNPHFGTVHKYLHQLQNLFYALTGEELPVNLKHNSLFI